MMTRLGLAAIATASAFLSTPASAAVIEWTVASGGNGHFYEYVSTTPSWDAARAAALASGGYLATITSSEENMFISTMVSGEAGFLGGTDRIDEYNWLWADGPEAGTAFFIGDEFITAFVTYANWNPNEPNDALGEDYLEINAFFGPLGGWNDNQGTIQNGYFVEYNAGFVNPVPEPATWAMMIAGFGLIGGAFRRRRSVCALA